jgi:transcriptional regulator with XRE-family HTH domain
VRELKISFNLNNKKDIILSKIQYKIINNLEKRLQEKQITISELSNITGISVKAIKNIMENKLGNINIKDLLIIAYVLGVNLSEIFDILLFQENKKDYTNGFIDGIYYSMQIIKNLDSDINLDKLLDKYNSFVK